MEQPGGFLVAADEPREQVRALHRIRPTTLNTGIPNRPREPVPPSYSKSIELFISEEEDYCADQQLTVQDNSVRHPADQQLTAQDNSVRHPADQQLTAQDNSLRHAAVKTQADDNVSVATESEELQGGVSEGVRTSSRSETERRADSGNFSLLAEHINRNILACFICSAKFVNPKVGERVGVEGCWGEGGGRGLVMIASINKNSRKLFVTGTLKITFSLYILSVLFYLGFYCF